MIEPSTLKSTLYRNKESKHHEYNRKNQESRMLNASNVYNTFIILEKTELISISEKYPKQKGSYMTGWFG
jgi:hypothetical protein